jgi:4-aminobutyrate aminotransferase-like enzyme
LYGNAIRISPPLNINKTDVGNALEILDDSFNAMDIN